jgi:hypothetical protein
MSMDGEEDQLTQQESANCRNQRQWRRHHPCRKGWQSVTARPHPQVLPGQREQALAEAVAALLRPLLEEMSRKLDAILARSPEAGGRAEVPGKRLASPRRRSGTRP